MGAVDEVTDGLSRKDVAGEPLHVYRRGDSIRVLSNTCRHRAAPLNEGELKDDCVVCPWHGSTFDLESGDVVHGTATAPQPKFNTRVIDGMLEVQLA